MKQQQQQPLSDFSESENLTFSDNEAQFMEEPSKDLLNSNNSNSNNNKAYQNLKQSKRNHVQIIDVWSHNLLHEMNHLAQFLIQCSQQPNQSIVIAIDTEFPGVIHRVNRNVHYVQNSVDDSVSPSELHYRALRSNVNQLKMIQLGLCFTVNNNNNNNNEQQDKEEQRQEKLLLDDHKLQEQQELHDVVNKLGEKSFSICWQFNFQFDLTSDLFSERSIRLLQSSGMDFDLHCSQGIQHAVFADMFISLGLLFNPMVTWLSFHGAYDFAYLMKLMNRNLQLPEQESDYFNLLRLFFPMLLDVKHMMRDLGGVGDWKNGGLNQLALELGVERCSGLTHQAGSDSVLTSQVFFGLYDLGYFQSFSVMSYNGILYGLGIGFEAYTSSSTTSMTTTMTTTTGTSSHQYHPCMLSCWTPGSPGASRYDSLSSSEKEQQHANQATSEKRQSQKTTLTITTTTTSTTKIESSSQERVCWWSLPENFVSSTQGKSARLHNQNNKKKQSTRRSNHNTSMTTTRKLIPTSATTNPHEPPRILNRQIKLNM